MTIARTQRSRRAASASTGPSSSSSPVPGQQLRMVSSSPMRLHSRSALDEDDSDDDEDDEDEDEQDHSGDELDPERGDDAYDADAGVDLTEPYVQLVRAMAPAMVMRSQEMVLVVMLFLNVSERVNVCAFVCANGDTCELISGVSLRHEPWLLTCAMRPRHRWIVPWTCTW